MICSHYIDVYQRKNENNKIVDWDAEKKDRENKRQYMTTNRGYPLNVNLP